MKTLLTVEESQRLIDLGVDPKMASYTDVVADESGNHYVEKLIFSLTDLLSILPKEINHQCLTIISTDKLYFAQYGNWEREYIHSWEQTFIPNDDCGKNSAPELIDALYPLLVWCLEHKIIKLNKD